LPDKTPRLRLLLDEHVSPAIASQLAIHRPELKVTTMPSWERGAYLSAPDDVVLRAAYAAELTLVTYDLRTIPILLKQWSEEETPHGGVIFVDTKTIAPNDLGGLVRALVQLCDAHGSARWRNRVVYLTRAGRPEKR
jgi:hypothetical protein